MNRHSQKLELFRRICLLVRRLRCLKSHSNKRKNFLKFGFRLLLMEEELRDSFAIQVEEGVAAGRMMPPEAASSDSTEHLT